jgi:hypothetical protein
MFRIPYERLLPKEKEALNIHCLTFSYMNFLKANLRDNVVLYRSLRCVYLESVCVCVTMEMKQFPQSLSQIFVAALKTDTALAFYLAVRLPQSILPCVIYGRLSAAQNGRGGGGPGGVYICSYYILTKWGVDVTALRLFILVYRLIRLHNP